ncbi:MAG TPA: universal stress protein [Desulfohalobiaceae bacterium]|nr:universal stress protein [Desulfohalobiaceae bacterium]
MTLNKKVMVAIDLSPYSMDTLKYAIDMSGRLGVELVIANVITDKQIEMANTIGPLSPTNITASEYIENQKKERLQKIQALLEYFPEVHRSYKVVFCIGVPHQALINLVRIDDIGLVILGPKAKKHFVGYETYKLFRCCPVPVLCLPEESEKHQERYSKKVKLELADSQGNKSVAPV